MAINTHKADHVEYIQDSNGNKHYLNAEYLDGHSYGDISNAIGGKADQSAIHDGTLTIQKNGATVATFTANQDKSATANITVPTSIDGLTGGTVNGNITLTKELVFANNQNPFIKMSTAGNTYFFQSAGGQFSLGPTWDLATKWSVDGSVQFPKKVDFAVRPVVGSKEVALKSEIPAAVSESTVSGWGFTKNKGTVTSVATADGITGGSITSSGTIKANLKSYTKNTAEIGGRLYGVELDKNGKLAVNVPWTDTNTDTHNSHAIISGTKSDGSTQIKGSASSGDITLGDSGVTAGAYGDTAAQTPGYNATFKVPSISVNAKGIVTAIGEHTVRIPASDNTDTKNTAGSTNDSSTLYLIGARTQVANSQTYSNSNVYMANGVLTTKNIRVSGTEATVLGHLTIYGDNDDDDPKKPADQTGISDLGDDLDAYYFNTGIALYNNGDETTYKLSFPGKTGTIALTSDLPTKVSELVNDSGYVKGNVLSPGGGYATLIANNGNAFSVTNSTVTSNGGGTPNAIFSIDSSGVHITKSGAKSDVVTTNNLKKINNNSLIGSGNINIPTMSHYQDHKGPYSADNNKDHIVYSELSTAHGNGHGCLIMAHGHIIYQSGYINITDTGTVYTDYDSYAVQAGQEGYWGKSWVTATAFFEPGKHMYVHAKGVESIYVICIYF